MNAHVQTALLEILPDALVRLVAEEIRIRMSDGDIDELLVGFVKDNDEIVLRLEKSGAFYYVPQRLDEPNVYPRISSYRGVVTLDGHTAAFHFNAFEWKVVFVELPDLGDLPTEHD